ncbi:MAG: lactate utilization protein [Candidatus Taylorbacteria bacterium]|nr:lactate utilization protein [Candidatus Taylorbacteria bacterium]
MDYKTPAKMPSIRKTMESLMARNINAIYVKTKEEALEKVKSLIPDGAEVMTGSSTTLEEIGFVDLLKKGKHPWKNLKNKITAEKDSAKQNELRKISVSAEYFLGSAHAISENGELVFTSASGSQIPSYAFTSQNVIWVVGTQKIVPNLTEAFKRVKEYVFPLEDERMKKAGFPGSVMGMWLIFERNIMGRKLSVIFVNENLGF